MAMPALVVAMMCCLVVVVVAVVVVVVMTTMMTTMMTYPGSKVFPTGQAGTLLLGGTAKAEAATSSLGF